VERKFVWHAPESPQLTRMSLGAQHEHREVVEVLQ
jgi:hypothetical protein